MADIIVPTPADKITSVPPNLHPLSGSVSNQQMFVVFTAQQAALLTRLGAWMQWWILGAYGYPQLAIWDYVPGSNGASWFLLGYTGSIQVGAAANYEAALIWSAFSAGGVTTPVAVRLQPGRQYGLGLHNEGGQIGIGYPSGLPSRVGYFATRVAGNPGNPFGGHSASASPNWPTMYGVAKVSEAPVATPTGPAASIATITPNLTATLTDPDSGSPTFDRAWKYSVELRQTGQTALIWQPPQFVVPAPRPAVVPVTIPYTGPTLDDVAHEWRIQAQDETNAVGEWSAWHGFTIENVGQIDMANASPTGKRESGTVTNWVGRWVHPTPLNANGARVRILSGGAVIRGGDAAPFVTLSPTVANNSFITLPDSSTLLTQGAAGPLPSGTYTFQMQGRATDGSVTPWSDEATFTINSPPNQPADLRPVSGSRLSARPRLDWLVSDPDLDDVLGADLTTVWEITQPSGSVVTGTSGLVDPQTGRGYIDLTPTEAPANGDYLWRVKGRDQSAIGTPSYEGPWSAPALFTLIAAPIVAITAPSENAVILTSAPQIAWTVAGGSQTFFRVQLYRPNTTVPFFGSGQLPATSGSSGVYLVPGGLLQNGLTYDAEVTIWTAGDIVSTSPKRRFTVQYPTDITIVGNLAGTRHMYAGDYEPASIVLSWSPTGYADFAGYIVSRRLGTEEPAKEVIIAHIKAAGQTSFVDYHAPPNVSLIYAVRQIRKVGADIRQSPAAEIPIDLPLGTPVLASALSGSDIRAPVMMLDDDYTEGFAREESTIPTWGTKGLPTLVRSPEGYGQRLYALGITILGDERGTIQDHMRRWRRVLRSGHPFSLRTETEQAFVRLVPGTDLLQRTQTNGVYDVKVIAEEIYWNEAVTVKT